jgi:hypothetical protein
MSQAPPLWAEYSMILIAAGMNSVKHVGIYTGAMVAASVVSGSGLQIPKNLMDGITMGVASMGNEVVHYAVDMPPTRLSSAAATGVYFAILQSIRGDNSTFIRNTVAGAATDMAAGYYYKIMGDSRDSR